MNLRHTMLVLSLLISGSALAQSWPSATRFESAIAAFEQKDKQNPPPEGAILCIGSSSMAKWNAHIAQDLAPLTVIPRGFGGSVITNVIYFANRVVFPYKPRAILLYEGDNDTNAGIPPAVIVDKFEEFFSLVEETMPGTRIYVISIKPSVARQHIWPVVEETNKLLAQKCAANDRLTFIDASTILLTPEGTPRTDVLIGDNLHMNPEGYKTWTGVIRPVLMEKEAQYETAAPAL